MAYKYRPPRPPRSIYPYHRRRPTKPKKDPTLPITYASKPFKWSSTCRTTHSEWQFGSSEGTPSVIKDDLYQSPIRMEDRTGYIMPAYRELIRNQREATTAAYSWTKYGVEAEDGHMEYRYKDLSLARYYHDTRKGQILTFSSWPTPTSLMSSDLDGQAQSIFLQKLYNKQTTFSGGKFLVELRQTVHGITHPLQAIYNGMFDYFKTLKGRAFSRRYIKRLPRYGSRVAVLNRMVASTWLEFQFGWKPLFSDIDDAMLALSYLTQRAPVDHVQGKAYATSSSVVDNNPTLSCGYYNLTWKTMIKNKTTVKYAGGAKAYLDDAVKGLSAKSLGVSLSDFVPSIWEGLPYSFLVDYFVNVGQVLEGSMAATGSVYYMTKTVHANTTQVPTDVRLVDTLGNSGQTGLVYRISATADVGNITATAETYQRTRVIPGSLQPSLRLSIPKLGSLRWANMAALIGQGKAVSNILTNLGRSKP